MASEIYMAIITGLLGVVGFFLTRSFAALDKKADKGELIEQTHMQAPFLS